MLYDLRLNLVIKYSIKFILFPCLSELSKKKRFYAPTVLEPTIQTTAGEKSLSKFNELTNQQQEVQDLRDCGLSTDEVDAKLHQVCTNTASVDMVHIVTVLKVIYYLSFEYESINNVFFVSVMISISTTYFNHI